MRPTSRQDLLLLHDEQLRTAAELDGATDTGRIGPLWLGRFGSRGFVSYRDLAGLHGAALSDLIAAALARFAADPAVADVEWKTRGHDAPADLDAYLVAAGFEAQQPETVMIGQAGQLAASGPLPENVVVRRAGTGGVTLADDVARVAALHAAVFGVGHSSSAETLLAALSGPADRNQLWLAEAGGEVVGAGRLAAVSGTRFAGLFGGATEPRWRHRGVYRWLTAARAGAALELGCDLVYAECTPFSRPILERSGLVAVTTTTPYLWARGSVGAVAP